MKLIIEIYYIHMHFYKFINTTQKEKSSKCSTFTNEHVVRSSISDMCVQKNAQGLVSHSGREITMYDYLNGLGGFSKTAEKNTS